MDSMASKYPKIVTLETYGSSSEKRPMRVIKISATGNDGSKPIVWLDGGIHGMNVLYFCDTYFKIYIIK